MKNSYQESLLSALQSRIDRRGEQLAFLEAYRAGCKALQRHDKRRQADQDLMNMKLDQLIDKRLFGQVKGLQHNVDYLNSIVDELGLVEFN